MMHLPLRDGGHLTINISYSIVTYKIKTVNFA